MTAPPLIFPKKNVLTAFVSPFFISLIFSFMSTQKFVKTINFYLPTVYNSLCIIKHKSAPSTSLR